MYTKNEQIENISKQLQINKQIIYHVQINK